jgi:putative transposase
MAQNTVFSQLIKQIPRSQFESWVHQHNGNKGIRSMDCWTWFGALMFGQLSGHDSIRAIERVFAHSDPKMNKLGFGPVRRSTLADANQRRPLEILENTFQYTLAKAKSLGSRKNGFRFKGQVLAMDSTTLQLCLELSPWAAYRSDQAAIKLHTAIDLAGELPEFAVIGDAKTQDIRVATTIEFKPGTTVVFDRGYSDYAWFNSLNERQVFFVTRARTNCQYEVIKSNSINRTRGHLSDELIRLRSWKGKLYKGYLRRISFLDPDTQKELVFLTNRLDLATQTICDLYKARWKIEIFFKTMKQHLKIRKFLGISFHAVKAQVLVALIAYLLVQIMRFQNKSRVSMPSAMAVISTLLLLKEPLSYLLGELPRVLRHPPHPQLLFDFAI